MGRDPFGPARAGVTLQRGGSWLLGCPRSGLSGRSSVVNPGEGSAGLPAGVPAGSGAASGPPLHGHRDLALLHFILSPLVSRAEAVGALLLCDSELVLPIKRVLLLGRGKKFDRSTAPCFRPGTNTSRKRPCKENDQNFTRECSFCLLISYTNGFYFGRSSFATSMTMMSQFGARR